MCASTSTYPAPDVEAVSVKLQEFYTSNPSGWFILAQAQFELRCVSSDETKHRHVIASLDAETAFRASHLLQQAIPVKKYLSLKDFLLKTLSLSPLEQVEPILCVWPRGPESFHSGKLHANNLRWLWPQGATTWTWT